VERDQYYNAGSGLPKRRTREERLAKKRARNKRWTEANKDKVNAANRRRYAEDPNAFAKAKERKLRSLAKKKAERLRNPPKPAPKVPHPMWVRVRLGGVYRHMWVVTPGRIAAQLKLSRNTLHKWIRQDIVPKTRIRYGSPKGFRVYTWDEAQIIVDVLEAHFERAKTGRIMRIQRAGIRAQIHMLWSELTNGVANGGETR